MKRRRNGARQGDQRHLREMLLRQGRAQPGILHAHLHGNRAAGEFIATQQAAEKVTE
jgi:hypothetical protein